MLSRNKEINFSFSILLFLLATTFKFSIILNGINVLLVSVIILALVYYWKYVIKIVPNQIAFYLLPFVLFIPIFTDYETFRVSSFLYGLLFLSLFQLILNFLYKGYISRNFYKKTLIFILRSYFIVALIQSVLFFLGIYFNQIWDEGSSNRINSLATEPSYAGTIVVIILYSYLLMDKIDKGISFSLKSNLEYFFYVTFIIVTSQSGFAIVFYAILLISILKNTKRVMPIFSIIIIILISIYSSISSTAIERVERLFLAISSFDVNKLAIADHSGSIRISPIIIFFRQLDLTDIYYWIGHGIGYTKLIMVEIIPGIDEELWSGAAFFPSFILDYGIICTIFFLLFIRKNTLVKIISFESLFLLLLFINSSFNTQMFWFVIIVFTTNKVLLMQNKNFRKIKINCS